MVTKQKDIFNNAISNSKHLNLETTNELLKLLDRFPYLQQAQAMVTKSLKDNKLFYKDALQSSAAMTMDRRVLFEYIEGSLFEEKPNIQKEKSNEEQNIKSASDLLTNKQEIEEEKTESDVKEAVVESKKADKMSYLAWLEQISGQKTNKNQEIFDPIERFLRNKPKIVPKRENNTKAPENIEKSLAEKQMLMTETLANLYLKQKKYNKAIQAFKILSLKYPKKSSYFANQIIEIKKKIK